jgi:hypothetical protein
MSSTCRVHLWVMTSMRPDEIAQESTVKIKICAVNFFLPGHFLKKLPGKIFSLLTLVLRKFSLSLVTAEHI